MIRPGVSQVFLTNAEWTAIDPVIPAHVTAISSDNGSQRIGDGIKKWSELTPSGEGSIARVAVQSNRLPIDNEMLVMCSAENKWIFRLIGCHLTETECAGMATTVYPNHAVIVEIDDATLVGTGRIKICDGTHTFGELPWIGAPSAEIMAHMNDTNNPHGTTATQVGLGNVTNHAQLKRAADDFTQFALKTSLNPNDVLLIEDSEDSFNKKRITVSTLEDMILAYVIALGA